ncbi:MAG TPA: hypothetical protein VES61_06970 [Gaiellaceae bacterium]|nr:hypothetical protein [Gaiellaceae bacterium]
MLSWKEPAKQTPLRLERQGARHLFEIQVSDARLQRSLLAFLGRTSYAVEARGDGILVIDPPGALDSEVARAELGVHLRAWERQTPGETARLVGRF